jgi:hypothetical protein
VLIAAAARYDSFVGGRSEAGASQVQEPAIDVERLVKARWFWHVWLVLGAANQGFAWVMTEQSEGPRGQHGAPGVPKGEDERC